ncbi:MAG: ribosome biogenesis GTP-binding protein YihA/YsxC [Azospirillaceae bacterium]
MPPTGPGPATPEDSDLPAGLRGLDREAGRLLFAAECTFELAVAALDQLPPAALPEVAFAGRSNVGKSSLVNALTGRKTLARTSNTPGRTQQLILFNLGGRLRLVDLPGYGYAKVPKDMVAAWTRLLTAYLRGRVPLRRACVLIDARHGIKPVDADIMGQLDTAAVPYRVVLTKADKIKPPAQARLVAEVTAALKTHPAALPDPIVTSAEKGLNIDLLRADLAGLALPSPSA